MPGTPASCDGGKRPLAASLVDCEMHMPPFLEPTAEPWGPGFLAGRGGKVRDGPQWPCLCDTHVALNPPGSRGPHDWQRRTTGLCLPGSRGCGCGRGTEATWRPGQGRAERGWGDATGPALGTGLRVQVAVWLVQGELASDQ